MRGRDRKLAGRAMSEHPAYDPEADRYWVVYPEAKWINGDRIERMYLDALANGDIAFATRYLGGHRALMADALSDAGIITLARPPQADSAQLHAQACTELAKLRVSVARIAQAVGAAQSIPGKPEGDFGSLRQAALNNERGWNRLCEEIVDRLAKRRLIAIED